MRATSSLLTLALGCASGTYVADPTWKPEVPSSMNVSGVSCIAIDQPTGDVFVGQRDAGASPVLVFTQTGTFKYGFGDGAVGKMHGMKMEYVDGKPYLWVTDCKAHVVLKVHQHEEQA